MFYCMFQFTCDRSFMPVEVTASARWSYRSYAGSSVRLQLMVVHMDLPTSNLTLPCTYNNKAAVTGIVSKSLLIINGRRI